MGGFLKKMEEWLGGGPGGAKRATTVRWLLIAGLTGVALMIVNSFVNVKEVDQLGSGRASPQQEAQQTIASTNKDKSSFSDYEHQYESQLKDILSKVVGVGDVEVMVTVESTEELNIQQNEKQTQETTNESDAKGAVRNNSSFTRDQQSVTYQAGGDQHPLVTKQVKPRIRGVVIVAKGAENLTVKKLILEAVERGLDVPAHRISVIPHKTQG